MWARRCRGARLQPNLRVKLDVRKPRRDLPQMRVEPVIFAFALPGRGDLAGGIAEHRAELMLYPNGIAEFFSHCAHASLRDVCPDAQDIREICNLDYAHPAFSRANSRASITMHLDLASSQPARDRASFCYQCGSGEYWMVRSPRRVALMRAVPMKAIYEEALRRAFRAGRSAHVIRGWIPPLLRKQGYAIMPQTSLWFRASYQRILR